MAREKELFRENLEQLNSRFPDKEVLKYEDLAKICGYRKRAAQRNWQKLYNRKIGGVPGVKSKYILLRPSGAFSSR